jgi:hypothetical protein
MSITHGGRRIRVEVTAPDSDPRVPSVVATYPAADWHERETWDMFGIIFDGHPALTRILMPDDWPGHPSARTTRSAGSQWNTRAGPCPRPTSGGPTTDEQRQHGLHRYRRGPRQSRPAAIPLPRPARIPTPASSTPSAATGMTSSARSAPVPRSASSSTWARSTRRRTACSADPRTRGRDGHRGPCRHRLSPHRHREEHGVPHLGAGRDLLHPHGLRHAAIHRDGLLPRGREAARHHRRHPERRQRHSRADDGAQPDHQPPGLHGHRRHGDGRHDGHDRRLPRARAHPELCSR